MEVKIDLTKVNKKSIANIIQTNTALINKAIETGSVSEVANTVEKLFKDVDLNTPASNRLLNNIRRSRTATEASFKVYNSCLCGTGNGVIK